MKFCLVFLLSLLYSFALFGQTIYINEVMTSNTHTILDEDGDYVDWIELYNDSDIPFSTEGFYLSDNDDYLEKWLLPSTFIEPYGFLLIYASGKDRVETAPFHTNFKLKSKGEALFLSNGALEIVDNSNAVELTHDQTYGRLLDGEGWCFLTNPTPGYTNNEETFITQVEFSIPSGFYDEPFYLKLNCGDPIYYTTDGSIPDLSSDLYHDSLLISSDYPNMLCLIPTNSEEIEGEFAFQVPEEEVNKAVVLKAMAFRDGVAVSPLFSQTYFTNGNEYSFPVISLSTNPENLFAPESGIYVPGETIDSDDIYGTGNYNMRGMEWEKDITIEFFDKDGESQFLEQGGLRIAGSRSRNGPQKSLRIYFREEYGISKIDYPFFDERENSEYKRLILRSPFSYWWKRNTLFQDDLIHEIIGKSGSDLDIQASEPAIVFLNGEYWGIQNLRERQDQHYLSSLHNLDKDSVDIVNGNLVPIAGSGETLEEIVAFIDANNLVNQDQFDYVSEVIDISNFIDYFIFETYFGNRDWPGNNVKLWRSQSSGGKWRFLLYDMDGAIGDVDSDPFDFPDPNRIIVRIFDGLCENENFKDQFIQRYVYLLNNSFDPANVQKIFDSFKFKYSPEVSEHIERWDNPNYYSDWNENCSYFMEFMEARPCIIKEVLINRFELDHLNEFNCLYDLEIDLVHAFPNPTQGNVSLAFDDLEEIKGVLNVFNSKGRLVYMEPLGKGSLQQFDFSFLASGAYIIRVDYNGKVATEKLIIQN